MKWRRIWACFAWLVAGAVLQRCADSPSGTGSLLHQFYTCGDPVCGSHRPHPGVPACTTQAIGSACASAGASCDPADACNRLIVCAAEDPATICPISRLRDKRDIRYLSSADRDRLHDQLLGFRLATYAYRAPDAAGGTHLGFLIDEVAPSPAVEGGSGDRVDLYGYTSMAVAALQAQERQIEVLRSELEELKQELAASRRECPARELPRR